MSHIHTFTSVLLQRLGQQFIHRGEQRAWIVGESGSNHSVSKQLRTQTENWNTFSGYMIVSFGYLFCDESGQIRIATLQLEQFFYDGMSVLRLHTYKHMLNNITKRNSYFGLNSSCGWSRAKRFSSGI